MVEELSERIKEIMKNQEDLDKRLKTIEADREEFKEMQRTNAKLHQDIQDLRSDIELQYKTSIEIQKESFEMMTKVYDRNLEFRQTENQSVRTWIVNILTALGGGATVAIILNWLTKL